MNNDKLIKVCPKPDKWYEIYQALCNTRDTQEDEIPAPPVPLILGGWGSSAQAKLERWNETLIWISRYCPSATLNLVDEDFYSVAYVSNVGAWDVFANYKYGYTKDPSVKPTKDELERLLSLLATNWAEVAGEIAPYTKAIRFAGSKSRRLIVRADKDRQPPWIEWNGKWGSRRNSRENYPDFAVFRARINELIGPHQVDHIDFKLDKF
jgi:hypothetical protein